MHQLAGFELVHRAAVWAFGMTGFGDIKEDARVAAPQLHAGLLIGAEDAALGIEVGGAEFYGWLHDVKPCLDFG